MSEEPAGSGFRRILIVRIGAMGDVLHALPAVLALRRALDGGSSRAVIGWAIEPRWAPLLGLHPDLVDRVHAVPTRAWKRRPLSLETARSAVRLQQELEAGRYEVAIDLQGSIRSAMVAALAGTGRVTGPAWPRELPAALFYDRHVELRRRNVIDQAAELVSAAAGLAIRPAQLVRGPVPLVHEDRSQPAAPWIVLAPTAGWGAKEWGAPNFSLLATELIGRGFRVLINAPLLTPGSTGIRPGHACEPGHAAEPGEPGHAAEAGYRAPDHVAETSCATLARTDLEGMMALVAGAALVIGGDTGPVHLAAALGVPTVALFGPTDPARNGPYFPGAHVAVIRHASSVTDHRRHQSTEAGLRQVRVEEVLAAALKLLNSRPRGEDHGGD